MLHCGINIKRHKKCQVLFLPNSPSKERRCYAATEVFLIEFYTLRDNLGNSLLKRTYILFVEAKKSASDSLRRKRTGRQLMGL